MKKKVYTIIVKGENVPEIDKIMDVMRKKFKNKAILEIVRHVLV